jgi:hypothetical protein
MVFCYGPGRTEVGNQPRKANNLLRCFRSWMLVLMLSPRSVTAYGLHFTRGLSSSIPAGIKTNIAKPYVLLLQLSLPGSKQISQALNRAFAIALCQ